MVRLISGESYRVAFNSQCSPHYAVCPPSIMFSRLLLLFPLTCFTKHCCLCVLNLVRLYFMAGWAAGAASSGSPLWTRCTPRQICAATEKNSSIHFKADLLLLHHLTVCGREKLRTCGAFRWMDQTVNTPCRVSRVFICSGKILNVVAWFLFRYIQNVMLFLKFSPTAWTVWKREEWSYFAVSIKPNAQQSQWR